MSVRLLAALAFLIALAALPTLWIFVAAAIVAIAWPRRRAPQTSTGTFLALVLYAGLIAIVLVTVRAALGWLERPTIPFEQTGIAPSLAHGSLGFYDKSELRLALVQLLALWVLFAAVLAAMWNGRTRRLHPLTAVFALVLYFASIQLPPYASSLGSALALMIGQLIAGAAMFVLLRWLIASGAMALFGTSCVLLLVPVADWSSEIAAPPLAWIGVLLYLAFVLRRRARGHRLARRELVIGASLLIAVACTLLSVNGAVYWALAPSVAFAAYCLIRLLSIRMAPARGFVPLALCLLFNALFPLDRLNERIASYTTRYEPAREAWYRECARAGSCDSTAKPSLAASLRDARL